jgi:hypothetical protein
MEAARKDLLDFFIAERGGPAGDQHDIRFFVRRAGIFAILASPPPALGGESSTVAVLGHFDVWGGV